MTALLSVEFRRILARRAVRALAALMLLGMLVGGTVLFVRSGSGTGFDLRRYREVASGLSGLFIVLFVAMGATFIGAEWHAGTLTTLLTWEPRRIRVLVAKVVAAALFAFLAYLLIQAVLFAVLLPSALFHGTTGGLDAAWVRGTTGLLLRTATLAGLGAAIGLSLASIARNTAAALGVAFVYLALVEPLIRALRPKWSPWLVNDNAGNFALGRPASFTLYGRAWAAAGVVIAAYTAGLVVVALAFFRRRDVT